ncbi:MAG: site-specific integrase [Anaerolineae bacterium]
MEEILLAFLDFLQEEYKYSNNTTAAYKNDLNQFVKFLHNGQYPQVSEWADVTAAIVHEYVEFMKSKSYGKSNDGYRIAAGEEKAAKYLNFGRS